LLTKGHHDINGANYLPKSSNQGVCYYAAQHDDKNAKRVYTKALSVNPANSRALALRGLSSFSMEDNYHAIIDLNSAIKISPKDAKLYNCRGVILRCQRRYKEALLDHSWAAKLAPTNPNYLDDKAYTNLVLGDVAQGLRDINQAIHLSPTTAGYHVTRAQLLNESGDLTGCIAAYDIAEKLGATGIYEARAEAKMNAGKYREALSDWTRVMNDSPDYAAIPMAKRGRCLMYLGLWSEAFVELTRSIDTQTDWPFIYAWRAEVNTHFGNYEAAADDYLQASKFFGPGAPGYCPPLASLLLERARVLEKLGKYSIAFEDLIAAQKADLTNRAIYVELLTLIPNYLAINGSSLLFSPENFSLIALHSIFRRRRIRRLL
jgi:tetratricopeptide (TPR) repeat protein